MLLFCAALIAFLWRPPDWIGAVRRWVMITAVFHLLPGFPGFGDWSTQVGWWGLLALSGLWSGAAFLRSTGHQIDRPRSPVIDRTLLGWLAVVLAIRVGLGLWAPVTGWDSLSYHGPHMAHWLSSGRPLTEGAGPAWAYYAHFPTGGERIQAFGVGLAGSLHGLAPMGLWGLVGVAIAAGAVARTLGCCRNGARLVAACSATMPSVGGWVISGYVDTLSSAAALCGVALFLTHPRRAADPLIGLMAVGLAASIKSSHMPLLWLLGIGWILRLLVYSPGSREGLLRQFGWLLGGCAFAVVVNGSAVAHLWQRGNLIYPFSVGSLPGLSPGNLELAEALASGPTRNIILDYTATVYQLFWGNAFNWPLPFLNPGPGVGLLAAMGAVGLGLCLARHLQNLPSLRKALDNRWGWTGLIVALTVAPYLLPSSNGLRTLWVSVFGRFLTVPLVILLATASSRFTPWRGVVLWILRAVLILNLVLVIPRGWTEEFWSWALLGAVPLLLIPVLLTLGSGRYPRVQRVFALLGAFGTAVSFDALLPQSRTQNSIPMIWREISENPPSQVFDTHGLDKISLGASPAWVWLAGREPLTVGAIWTERAGTGHHIYLTPLYGDRLQHRVLPIQPGRELPVPLDVVVLMEEEGKLPAAYLDWPVVVRYSNGKPMLLRKPTATAGPISSPKPRTGS